MSDPSASMFDDSGFRNGRRPVAIRTDRRRPAHGPDRIARYRLLVEEGVDVFSRHDRSGRFLDVSPAAAMVYGCPPAELLGRQSGGQSHPTAGGFDPAQRPADGGRLPGNDAGNRMPDDPRFSDPSARQFGHQG